MEQMQEEYWVEFLKTGQQDEEVLYHLERNNLEKAKEVLSESIKNKGMLFFIFMEENILSEAALQEIEKNRFIPDEET